jgi:outer membrane protein TolC
MNMMNRSASSSNANRKNFVGSFAVVAAFLLALPSCCIPGLRKADPPAPLPDTFNGATSAANSAQLCWRDFFEDQYLLALIDEALVGNQELKILAEDIRIANFEVLARSGEYLPFFSFGAGAGVEK